MTEPRHNGDQATWDMASDLNLKEFWEAGKSASWIAQTLTTNYRRKFTRNAIIGRAYRAQLVTGRTDLWPEARVKTLIDLWEVGQSAQQIASYLGTPVTRNAVVGKVKRLKLRRTADAMTASMARCSPYVRAGVTVVPINRGKPPPKRVLAVLGLRKVARYEPV